MSDGSKKPSKPRLCERCGKRMPPQKRGRPRRWCSQQCRQSAYEERHGLESWKDKQPKVDNLSDVIEAAQERAARQRMGRRYVTGIPALDRAPPEPQVCGLPRRCLLRRDVHAGGSRSGH